VYARARAPALLPFRYSVLYIITVSINIDTVYLKNKTEPFGRRLLSYENRSPYENYPSPIFVIIRKLFGFPANFDYVRTVYAIIRRNVLRIRRNFGIYIYRVQLRYTEITINRLSDDGFSFRLGFR